MEGAKPEPVGHVPFYDINMEGFGICVILKGCHMEELPYAPLSFKNSRTIMASNDGPLSLRMVDPAIR